MFQELWNVSTAVQAHAVGFSDIALERHYTIGEIAEKWHLDYKTVRKMFVISLL